MNPLERLTRRARANATPDCPLVVLNLNRVGAPLYAVRDAAPGDISGAGNCVAGPFYGEESK